MKDIVCWFSGGITSAVACKLAISLYGRGRCRVVFIDTKNEDLDTYRFLKDCSKWYGIEIESLSNIGRGKYDNIQDVWRKFCSLNVASGAICSAELKRSIREEFQRNNSFSHQVFGFDISEPKRAAAMAVNYKSINPVFPLLYYGLSKKNCIDMVEKAGIHPPRAYMYGFQNNNCLNTGCVQGGIGYWQKMRREFPSKFLAMAKMEHELTDKKGEPVTMLRDRAGLKKGEKRRPLFLLPHPDYPEHRSIKDKKVSEPKPLMECNGFCGVNDLMPGNPTYEELNIPL